MVSLLHEFYKSCNRYSQNSYLREKKTITDTPLRCTRSKTTTKNKGLRDNKELELVTRPRPVSVFLITGDITGLSVLDMGCGEGRHVQNMLDWGARKVSLWLPWRSEFSQEFDLAT